MKVLLREQRFTEPFIESISTPTEMQKWLKLEEL
jgi:hypothetical protein